MIDFTEIWNKAATEIANLVKFSITQAGRSATGKTIQEIEVVSQSEGAQVLAPQYIDVLESGRGPTSPNAPAGNPTVYEAIQEWAQARGIDQFETNDKGKTVDVWRAFTAHIHKYGFEGTPGILTGPLSDENISAPIDRACNSIADIIGNEALGLFDILTQ